MADNAKDSDGRGRAPAIGGATSRRGFLKGMTAATGAAALLGGGAATARAQGTAEPAVEGLTEYGREAMPVTLRINGQRKTLVIEPRTTLLDALRDHAGLTGSKMVCDRGSCGCCTVLLDGVAVNSCLMLAVDAVGHDVTTVEGVVMDPANDALVAGFCEHDGAQCGFCIPGFVVRGSEIIAKNPGMTREEIQEGLSGNLCRCGTYSKIFDSMESAVAKKGGA